MMLPDFYCAKSTIARKQGKTYLREMNETKTYVNFNFKTSTLIQWYLPLNCRAFRGMVDNITTFLKGTFKGAFYSLVTHY